MNSECTNKTYRTKNFKFSSIWMLIVFSSLLVTVLAATDYCKIDPKHTMCVHKDAKPDAKVCGADAKAATVDKKLQDEFVKGHNSLRTKAATGKLNKLPSAVGMLELVWDAELATIAERWAMQCNPVSDDNRNVHRFGVEQNIYQESGEKAPALDKVVKNAMDKWANETALTEALIKKYVAPKDEKTKADLPTGGNVRMLLDKIEFMGCGLQQFVKEKNTVSFVVCNYGPMAPKSFVGKDIYETGKVCSKCPAKHHCKDGLCSKKGKDKHRADEVSSTTAAPATTKGKANQLRSFNSVLLLIGSGLFIVCANILP